jgi:hypothetical protein
LRIHLDILCVHAKFHENENFMTCVKNSLAKKLVSVKRIWERDIRAIYFNLFFFATRSIKINTTWQGWDLPRPRLIHRHRSIMVMWPWIRVLIWSDQHSTHIRWWWCGHGGDRPCLGRIFLYAGLESESA